MVIVRVKWTDWNGVARSTDVTSDMCEALGKLWKTEDMLSLAVKYIKRRYTEWNDIYAAEIIAR